MAGVCERTCSLSARGAHHQAITGGSILKIHLKHIADLQARNDGWDRTGERRGLDEETVVSIGAPTRSGSATR